jgi:D-glycero-alpha-D-manno-heptose-7-phosphate kinase
MLFFTGVTRKAESVLTEQVQNIPMRLDILAEMKRLALEANTYLCAGELDKFGLLLHEGWLLKKQLANRISNSTIDELYQKARDAGALGGKVTGAGGGGYLLLYCPRQHQDAVRAALCRLCELPFHLERDGSKVIFNYRH